MNSTNNYSDLELIHLYLDGECSDTQQEVLFRTLAGSSELQEQFGLALGMRAAMEIDSAATVPPPELRSALMHKAGFMEAAAHGAGHGSLRRIADKLVVPLLSAAAGALFMALVIGFDTVQLPGRSAENTSAQQFGHTGRETAQAAQLSRLESQTATQPGFSSAGAGSTSRTTPPGASGGGALTDIQAGQRHNTRHAGAQLGGAEPQEPPAHRDIPAAVSASRLLPTAEIDSPYLANALRSPLPARAATLAADITPTADSEEFDNAFSIRMRNLSGLVLVPHRDMPPQSGGFLANAAFGLYYELSPQHALGIELGQEDFPLYSDSVSGDERESVRSWRWIGLAWHHEARSLGFSEQFWPHAGLIVGASRSGPIGRLEVGLVYQPENRINISLGIETAGLLYQNGGQWFGTGKLNAVTALRLRLP